MSKQLEAEKKLKELGYMWWPIAKAWIKSARLPNDEAIASPGRYRCASVKPVARTLRSWDGYTLAVNQTMQHFDLDLKPRKWKPPVGYENQVVFAPVNIVQEMSKLFKS